MNRFYVAMHQAVNPHAQSRNDLDIFAELSDRLGFGREYTEGRDEMAWLRHMYEVASSMAGERGYSLPSFDEFWQVGLYEFPQTRKCTPFLGEFRDNPASHPLKTPSGKIEIYSSKIASFGYDDCPGHPAWLEPSEWLGSSKAKRFPIHLLSNQPRHRLHSQLDPAALSMKAKILKREPIRMNGQDAALRGLKDGDTVRVFNDRGEFISAIMVSDAVRPGVAQIATGAWYDPLTPGKPSLEKHGNPNVVTLDKGTSKLGQSSIAQTVLVEIEACPAPPAVTAFDNPTVGMPDASDTTVGLPRDHAAPFIAASAKSNLV